LPAFEQLAEVVKDRDPASAATAEPGTPAPEGASCPGERDPLPDVLPIGRAARARTVDQEDGIGLGPEFDRTGWFAIAGPSRSPRRPRLQQLLPLQAPNINGLAAFNRWAPTEGVSGHQFTIIEIIWEFAPVSS
jgi:hypothetical protein